MDEREELPLDTDLLRWYLQKRSQMHFTSERHVEYSTEIWIRLSNNMAETMDFLQDCADAELDALGDVIEDLIFDFKRDQSEKDYNEFIEFLQELAMAHPHSQLKKNLEFVLLSISDEEDEEIVSKA